MRVMPSGRTSISSLLARLKVCSGAKDLETVKLLHADIASFGADSNVHLASSLVNVYSRCRSMGDARKVFDRIVQRDLMLWNTLMLGYVANGEDEQAFNLFTQLRSEGHVADGLSYVTVLKACMRLAEKEKPTESTGKLVKLVALEKGKLVHRDAGKNTCSNLDVRIPNTLLSFYFKCGSVENAFQVFHRMPAYSPVSWTVMILGCAENSEADTALGLFRRMKCRGYPVDAQVYVAALKACTRLALRESGGALEAGRLIYSEAVEDGFGEDKLVGNCSIDMFAKCGSLVDARNAFDRIVQRDASSFTSLMLGYIENGNPERALDVFEQLQHDDECNPSSQVFEAALEAYSVLAEEETGETFGGMLVKVECLSKVMAMHSRISTSVDIFVASALVNMYFRCGSIVDARRVFDSSRCHNAELWTALLLGYTECGEESLAFQLFSCMKASGLSPDARTYDAV